MSHSPRHTFHEILLFLNCPRKLDMCIIRLCSLAKPCDLTISCRILYSYSVSYEEFYLLRQNGIISQKKELVFLTQNFHKIELAVYKGFQMRFQKKNSTISTLFTCISVSCKIIIISIRTAFHTLLYLMIACSCNPDVQKQLSYKQK